MSEKLISNSVVDEFPVRLFYINELHPIAFSFKVTPKRFERGDYLAIPRQALLDAMYNVKALYEGSVRIGGAQQDYSQQILHVIEMDLDAIGADDGGPEQVYCEVVRSVNNLVDGAWDVFLQPLDDQFASSFYLG